MFSIIFQWMHVGLQVNEEKLISPYEPFHFDIGVVIFAEMVS